MKTKIKINKVLITLFFILFILGVTTIIISPFLWVWISFWIFIKTFLSGCLFALISKMLQINFELALSEIKAKLFTGLKKV